MMGGLDADLVLEGNGEAWTARLSPSWDLVTPNGGYLGALSLSAAREIAPSRVPVSIACTFLSAAASGKRARLDVNVLRSTKRADVLTIDLSQDGRQVLRSTVWRSDADASGGLVHDVAQMPSVPPPVDVAPSPASPRKDFPFYENIEERLLSPAGEAPEWLGWYRFIPAAAFGDATTDNARALILLDALPLSTCLRAHPSRFCLATTTQTNVVFCAEPSAHESEWLLLQMRCPISRGGMLFAEGTVWSEMGRLLAHGQSSMIYIGPVVDR